MSEMTIGCALWTLGRRPMSPRWRVKWRSRPSRLYSVQPWIVNFEFTIPVSSIPKSARPPIGARRGRIAESLGLTFSGFCAQLQGAVTWGGLEESEGLQWRIDKTKQALDTTAELGGNIVTTHAGVLPEDKSDPAYEILLGSVGEIAEHGAKVGVYFALETGQETPQALGDFIDEIGNPWLKVNYDPCNLLRFGSEAGTIQGVAYLGRQDHPYARQRLESGDDASDLWRRAWCPWDGYIQALRDIGYSWRSRDRRRDRQ